MSDGNFSTTLALYTNSSPSSLKKKDQNKSIKVKGGKKKVKVVGIKGAVGAGGRW